MAKRIFTGTIKAQMASPCFTKYLKNMKRQAENADLIVVGNQGADLDSIVSALVLGWHLAGQQPQKEILALITIPRQKLKLRPDLQFVLAQAKIDPEELLFSDDVELDDPLQRVAEFVLVDHNSLDTTQRFTEHRVTAIIDHHHDEGQFPNAKPRIIAEVGSTATLIGELILSRTGEMEPTPALLLLSAILIDTANLNDKAGRSTDRDKKMVAKLLSICGVERETFFKDLEQAQYDLSELNSKELLIRDYKEWQTTAGSYGMSTVLLSLSHWQQRDSELDSAIAQFALRKKLSVLMVMMASHDPDFQRELILFSRDKELHSRMNTFLDNQGLRLSVVQETRLAPDKNVFVGMYNQGNAAISRKKLQPLVHSFLASALLLLC